MCFCVCMYVKYREATPPRLESPKEALLEAPGLRSRHHLVSRVHWAPCVGDSLEWLGKLPAEELLCAVPQAHFWSLMRRARWNVEEKRLSPISI